MKNSIITIASTIALVISLTSCKEDNSELIQKIETAQTELQQQDSALTNQRNELSKLVFTDTTKQNEIEPTDTALTMLVSQQNALITRLEVIIQKNKELITQLNDDSVNPKEAETEYTAHVDELELMKPEINSAKESYEKLVKEVEDTFKNLGDTTKTK
jgi:chromosome segregation ATPase